MAGTCRLGVFALRDILPPNPRLQRTRLRSPLSRQPFGGAKLQMIFPHMLIALVATAGQAVPHPSGRTIEIHVKSSWEGLVGGLVGGVLGPPIRGVPVPTPPPPDPTEYTVRCNGTECPETVQWLIRCLEAPPKAEFQPSDLAPLISWVQNAQPEDIQKANSGAYHALYSVYASRSVREAFDATRADSTLINKILADYYDPRVVWSDDSPHVSATIHLSDGSMVSLTSSANQAFMIPWSVSRRGSEYRTYEPDIGRVLAALAPPRFQQGDRLSGAHLKYWLVSEVFQIAFRKAGPK